MMQGAESVATDIREMRFASLGYSARRSVLSLLTSSSPGKYPLLNLHLLALDSKNLDLFTSRYTSTFERFLCLIEFHRFVNHVIQLMPRKPR